VLRDRGLRHRRTAGGRAGPTELGLPRRDGSDRGLPDIPRHGDRAVVHRRVRGTSRSSVSRPARSPM
jgi:hypothetical protein